MREQVLDSMDIERERGITIKAQTVRSYTAKNGETYELNLNGHAGSRRFCLRSQPLARRVRGLAAGGRCQPGVEAQNPRQRLSAIDAGHEIVPVLNKIDLPAAEPARVKEQIGD